MEADMEHVEDLESYPKLFFGTAVGNTFYDSFHHPSFNVYFGSVDGYTPNPAHPEGEIVVARVYKLDEPKYQHDPGNWHPHEVEVWLAKCKYRMWSSRHACMCATFQMIKVLEDYDKEPA